MTHGPHGGDLADARRLAPTVAAWLDLSTGINPHAYPAAVAAETLARLPQRDARERLLAAARRAYRVPHDADIVAAPGSEAIIGWLPRIFPADRVAVVGPTYASYAAAFGRVTTATTAATLDPAADVNVLANPNNPDGRMVPPSTLTAFAGHAQSAGPVLIVDEAFGDLVPHMTVAGAPGTLVLRSFGKFYGLPGLRLGFAIGAPAAIGPIRDALGPWAVSGPALAVGAVALEDEAWAAAMRRRLAAERVALDALLARAGLVVIGGTDLFRLVEHPDAAALQAALARRGIWTRAFPDAPKWLRIGLPGEGVPRLSAAIEEIGDDALAA